MLYLHHFDEIVKVSSIRHLCYVLLIILLYLVSAEIVFKQYNFMNISMTLYSCMQQV